MKQEKFISRTDALIIGAFLIVMMVVGSIWDFQISSALYDQSSAFGIFFAAFGEVPAMAGLVAAGIMLILGRNTQKKVICILQSTGGALLVLFGFYELSVNPGNYMEMSAVAGYIIGLVLTAATIAAFVYICKNAKREDIIRAAAAIGFVILAEMVIINIIKIPWGRARMRLVAEDPEAYFMPWWQAGSELKDSLVSAGVASEEFKSFPSGHTGNAAVLMMLTILPVLCDKLKGKGRILLWTGFAWTVLVALSRIIMGAHYLTDTTIGFTVGFLCVLIIPLIVFRKRKDS